MKKIDEQYLQQLGNVAKNAGKTLLDFQGKTLAQEVKEDLSIVTEADIAAEEIIFAGLQQLDKDCPILSEERSPQIRQRPRQFIVDPLDGTSNYASGFPWYAVSIAYECEGEVVAGAIYIPPRDELILAITGHGAHCNGRKISVSSVSELKRALLGVGFYYHRDHLLDQETKRFSKVQRIAKGVRRPGSAVLDLISVARGWFDGFWELGLKPWDLAAGCLIAKEAGATLSNYQGEAHSIYGETTIATNGHIHQQLQQQLGQEKGKK